MIIYLDFDGTVVEHEYPKMGREVPHAMRVIQRLQDAGHTIVLNTYRADCGDGTLEKAVQFINYHPHYEVEIKEALINKRHPGIWDLKDCIENNRPIAIDDISHGIPLMPSVMTTGEMVDWVKIEKELEQYKILAA